MKRNIDKLANGHYDLLVIGGGINGAAIAHMAALNDMEVALIEKGDFASGTSSKSTKLIHGGLRYLENFEFGLVQESLKERALQLKAAPHLVKPLEFVIPVYKSDARPLWKMKLGVLLYDLLSGRYKIGKRGSLSVSDIVQLLPGVNSEELLGGVSYFDAQMDDARLVLENVLSADYHGADVANYVQAQSLLKQLGKTIGVKAYDHIKGEEFEIRAKKTVCCAGPWTNVFMELEKSDAPAKIRTTKGSHLVYKGEICKKALLFSTKEGGRIFFIIPFHGNSLIGTTDTDYSGNPDEVATEEEDMEYLFKEAQRVLPFMALEEHNIITTFSGLRPLINDEGDPSKLSRKHKIEQSYSGIVYVIGGKYTTYRKIAEDCIKFLIGRTPVDTEKSFTLFGSGEIEEDIEVLAQEYDLDEATIEYLVNTYGVRFRDILKLIQDNPALKEPICDFAPAIKAQIQYSRDIEMAQTDEDILTRRLSLSYMGEVPQEAVLALKK